MDWIVLIVAGFFETFFAFSLGKANEASGRLAVYWYVAFVLNLAISMVLLVKATQTLPIGTAYAVWTGIGAVGTVLFGVFVFNEPLSFFRVFFLITLILSIVGLKLFSS